MTVNRKVTGTASSIPGGLTQAVLLSLAITAALSALSAWLVGRGTVPENAIGYCSMVILPVSAASGAGMAVRRIRRLRFQMALAAGGLYFLCLLAATALFFGGDYAGVGVTLLMILCGCGLVILLGSGSGNRAGCRKRKKRVW